MSKKKILVVVVLILISLIAAFIGVKWYRYQLWQEVGISGGELRPAQAAYDVQHYALAVRVFPEEERISGSNTVTVVTQSPLSVFELQLDDRLVVSSIEVDGKTASFTHQNGLISVPLSQAWQPGERHAVKVSYAGEPIEALMPPWIDGLVWEETPSGKPWIGTTTQGSGGDLWWPVKDHPSDEPDEGMSIALTVPEGLTGLTNGRLVGKTTNPDGSITSHWKIGYPINNYAVSLNIAPYVPIEAPYTGINGNLNETIIFWAIPEHVEKAKKLWAEQGAKILRVLGKRFGEYPFINDKYWVAETPYLGMEHQTIVAYGSNFKNNDFGFDSLLLHETAHEWWGNKITARDWADFWIHEGFGSYAEAVYVNDTLGLDRYLDYMRKTCAGVKNQAPIIQGKNLTEEEAYISDIYTKGACVLHALRWLVGDEVFFKALYKFQNDPRYAYKLVDTEDFTSIVENLHGESLDWFWQRYLYKAQPPQLTVSQQKQGDDILLTLQWADKGFAMPLQVMINGELKRIAMPVGEAKLRLPVNAAIEIDPQDWVLAQVEDKRTKQ